jgi:hypothetical protein
MIPAARILLLMFQMSRRITLWTNMLGFLAAACDANKDAGSARVAGRGLWFVRQVRSYRAGMWPSNVVQQWWWVCGGRVTPAAVR